MRVIKVIITFNYPGDILKGNWTVWPITNSAHCKVFSLEVGKIYIGYTCLCKMYFISSVVKICINYLIEGETSLKLVEECILELKEQVQTK